MEDLVGRSHDERHVHALRGREGDLRLVCHGGIVPRTAATGLDVIEPTREYSAGAQMSSGGHGDVYKRQVGNLVDAVARALVQSQVT